MTDPGGFLTASRRAGVGLAAFFALAGVGGGLAGCGEAPSWREFALPDSGQTVRFPCRPERHARTLQEDGHRIEAQMWACEAQGRVYAVVETVPLPPERVVSVLSGWVREAPRRLAGGRVVETVPDWRWQGAVAWAPTVRLRLEGEGGGRPLHLEMALASLSGRLLLAQVLGPPGSASDPFWGALAGRPLLPDS